jgi:hypothetical protein
VQAKYGLLISLGVTAAGVVELLVVDRVFNNGMTLSAVLTLAGTFAIFVGIFGGIVSLTLWCPEWVLHRGRSRRPSARERGMGRTQTVAIGGVRLLGGLVLVLFGVVLAVLSALILLHDIHLMSRYGGLAFVASLIFFPEIIGSIFFGLLGILCVTFGIRILQPRSEAIEFAFYLLLFGTFVPIGIPVGFFLIYLAISAF